MKMRKRGRVDREERKREDREEKRTNRERKRGKKEENKQRGTKRKRRRSKREGEKRRERTEEDWATIQWARIVKGLGCSIHTVIVLIPTH